MSIKVRAMYIVTSFDHGPFRSQNIEVDQLRPLRETVGHVERKAKSKRPMVNLCRQIADTLRSLSNSGGMRQGVGPNHSHSSWSLVGRSLVGNFTVALENHQTTGNTPAPCQVCFGMTLLYLLGLSYIVAFLDGFSQGLLLQLEHQESHPR